MPTAKRSPTAKNDSASVAEAPPKTRKPSRPRIDAIVNAIGRGDYDDKLKDLRDAIDKRNESRRADVLALVHEVYGDGVTITQPRGITERPNPFTQRSAGQQQGLEAQQVIVDETTETEIPSITSSSKSVQVVRGPDDEDLDGDGTVTVVASGEDEIISNSPTLS